MAELRRAVIAGPPADGNAWSAQLLIWSERQRGRALLWRQEDDWFCNDPLGPMPHTHPHASETYLVVAGSAMVTVGRDVHRMDAGDFCLIPPDTYHGPERIGSSDLLMFVVVAPNWRGRRWKNADFVDSDYDGQTTVVGTETPGALPGDVHIQSEVLSVMPGEVRETDFRDDADRTLYVLNGALDIRVDHLAGTLRSHDYVHVMAGAHHLLSNRSAEPALVLASWTPGPK